MMIAYFGSLLIAAGALNIWILIIGRTMTFIFECGKKKN